MFKEAQIALSEFEKLSSEDKEEISNAILNEKIAVLSPEKQETAYNVAKGLNIVPYIGGYMGTARTIGKFMDPLLKAHPKTRLLGKGLHALSHVAPFVGGMIGGQAVQTGYDKLTDVALPKGKRRTGIRQQIGQDVLAPLNVAPNLVLPTLRDNPEAFQDFSSRANEHFESLDEPYRIQEYGDLKHLVSPEFGSYFD